MVDRFLVSMLVYHSLLVHSFLSSICIASLYTVPINIGYNIIIILYNNYTTVEVRLSGTRLTGKFD